MSKNRTLVTLLFRTPSDVGTGLGVPKVAIP